MAGRNNMAFSFMASLLMVFCNSCDRNDKGEQKVTFTNPVIHADYSDPDVVRTGDDYYMVASSFNCVPGIPVLHSNDLVNWRLIGYALNRLQPYEYFRQVRHGEGVWAPCIRFHGGNYYIYYPDPDRGIFMVKAADPQGPWSDPVMVKRGRGLIDPSPLWDDDGRAYLVWAFAGSRAGVKSVLMVSRLRPDGTATYGDDVMVFDGHDANPTVEGPKFYRHKGYYYIFAPAGGVTFGWQLVLRSKNIFGPYESKIVLKQGKTAINGPHQGAWVTTHTGEDWFIHFQDKGAYGRIVHLQPMKWVNDWPVIGSDDNGDGTGEPVTSYAMPDVGKKWQETELQTSDEFNDNTTGLQWQWQANPSVTWGYPSAALGCYRLNCIARPDSMINMWSVPDLFLQKLPGESFTAIAAVKCNLRYDGEEAGMIVMGKNYQYISVKRSDNKLWLNVVRCSDADKGTAEEITASQEINSGDIFFRIKVNKGAQCTFGYSTDCSGFNDAGEVFTAREGVWIGAKIGFFALRDGFINDAGWIDLDWLRIEKTE
jgi:beta-xylosidase